MANFKELTRYTNGSIFTNRSNKQFLILRQSLNLGEDEGDIFISIDKTLTQRPDLISQKAYGTPDLWWAIYEFNGIKDPLFQLEIGQLLRIPDKDRLIQAINRLNT